MKLLLGRVAAVVLVTAAAFGCSTAADGVPDEAERPYAGWQERGVASLSEGDIQELLEGAGHGYALSAELNGHPGPAHVLELAGDLELDDSQRDDVEAIHSEMNAAARDLGEQLVAAEFALDEVFRAGTDAATVEELTERSAAIEARLRATHLQAHLDTTALLTEEQIRRYDHLRGYADGHDASHGGHESHADHGSHDDHGARDSHADD
jgi:Spy/CpxP family protein refolding chaperone